MRAVKIETSEKVFKTIMEKIPWLGYADFEAFVNDAVRVRATEMLRVANTNMER